MKIETTLAVDCLNKALTDNSNLQSAVHSFIIATPDVYSAILKCRFKNIYELIQSSFGSKFSEKAFSYVNGESSAPICLRCANPVKWGNRYSKGYPKHCSMSCLNKSSNHIGLIKAKNLANGNFANGFNDDVFEKIKATNLLRFGNENFFATEHFKSAYAKTSMERYGVPSPMQNRAVAERCQGRYKRKQFILDGKEYVTQGYEDVALRWLLAQGLAHHDIKTGVNIPTIPYVYENTSRAYHPDIYIPKYNLIIEVKSQWTMKSGLSQNLHKHHGTICRNYRHMFLICDYEKILHMIIDDEVPEANFTELCAMNKSKSSLLTTRTV